MYCIYNIIINIRLDYKVIVGYKNYFLYFGMVNWKMDLGLVRLIGLDCMIGVW